MAVTITRDDLALILSSVSQMLADRPMPIARDGICVADSYNPVDGTITVLPGDVATVFPEDAGNDQQGQEANVPVVTVQNGDQFGLVGNERVVLIPTQSGYVALQTHGPDDSPQAPKGERWICHRDSNGNIDSYVKLQTGASGPIINSGAQITVDGTVQHLQTIIDGSANNITHSVPTSIAGAAQPIKTVLDGAANQIAHTVPNPAGNLQTIIDGSGNAISHVVPTGGLVGLGSLASTLDSTRAVPAQADLETLSNNIFGTSIQSLMQIMCTAMASAGIPNAAAFEAIVTATNWIMDNITLPTIPGCSSLVRLAE